MINNTYEFNWKTYVLKLDIWLNKNNLFEKTYLI